MHAKSRSGAPVRTHTTEEGAPSLTPPWCARRPVIGVAAAPRSCNPPRARIPTAAVSARAHQRTAG